MFTQVPSPPIHSCFYHAILAKILLPKRKASNKQPQTSQALFHSTPQFQCTYFSLYCLLHPHSLGAKSQDPIGQMDATSLSKQPTHCLQSTWFHLTTPYRQYSSLGNNQSHWENPSNLPYTLHSRPQSLKISGFDFCLGWTLGRQLEHLAIPIHPQTLEPRQSSWCLQSVPYRSNSFLQQLVANRNSSSLVCRQKEQFTIGSTFPTIHSQQEEIPKENQITIPS